MSEFRGGGSGSKRFDTFFNEEVKPSEMSDEEIREKIIQEKRERRERERSEKRKTTGNRLIALALAAGLSFGGIVFTNSVEKGVRKDEFNSAAKNYTWEKHGVTTYPDDLSTSQFADIEEQIMTDKARDIYDIKKGDGAFDELDESHQDALVGETYNYYDREENIPEDIADADELDKEWAHAEIGHDTTLDKIKDWFDNKN